MHIVQVLSNYYQRFFKLFFLLLKSRKINQTWSYIKNFCCCWKVSNFYFSLRNINDLVSNVNVQNITDSNINVPNITDYQSTIKLQSKEQHELYIESYLPVPWLLCTCHPNDPSLDCRSSAVIINTSSFLYNDWRPHQSPNLIYAK